MGIMKTPFLPVVLGLLAIAPWSHAVVLAEYRFPSAAVTSTDTDPTSAAGSFSVSGGTATGFTNPQAGFSSSGSNAFFRSSSLTNTAAGAVTDGDYFSFTLTPAATYNLTTLTFNFGGNNGGAASPEFTASTFLRSSLDGFTSDIGLVAQHTIAAATTATATSPFSINLSAPQFQNLSTPVTFRFYVYNSASVDAQIARLDDVVLNGNLVPEPTIALLGSLGALAALARRRRA